MVGLLSNKIQRDELKPGDHIYSWRHSYLYSHHGIYVGDEMVIHFTRSSEHETGAGTVLDRFIFSSSPHSSGTPCPRCGDQSKASGVISSCLNCFLSGGELYLFEYGVSPATFLAKVRGGTCTLAKSDPSDDVLHRAKFLLQNGFGEYDIFKNNCEDFSIYCRTELVSLGQSGQATSFVAAAKAAVSSTLGFMNAVASSPLGFMNSVASSPLGFMNAVTSSPLRFVNAVASSRLCFMTTGIPGVVVLGCGIYCQSRLVSDIGVRGDVMKIPVERLIFLLH